METESFNTGLTKKDNIVRRMKCEFLLSVLLL